MFLTFLAIAYLFHLIESFSVANASFYQVTLNTLGILPTYNNSLSRSRLQCSALCLSHAQTCQHFLYHSENKLCLDLRSTGIKASSSDSLYSQSTRYCDVSLGYNSTIMRTYGLCLSISRSISTFSAANTFCSSIQGRLIMIKTITKTDLVLKIMQDNTISSVWIGLGDVQNEGTYVCSNGDVAKPNKMTMFLPGQPDNFYNSDCMILLKVYKGLDDIACSRSETYFCEYVI
ncbi:CD209 antigen-like protein E [Biomphalaria glabrata]|nr:CD209 antigen-like protein E [Biomphalaria glabrata]